jgi:hypothetical protein
VTDKVKIGGGIGEREREMFRWKISGMRRKQNKTRMENNAKWHLAAAIAWWALFEVAVSLACKIKP